MSGEPAKAISKDCGLSFADVYSGARWLKIFEDLIGLKDKKSA